MVRGAAKCTNGSEWAAIEQAANPVKGRDDGDGFLWEAEDSSGKASGLVSSILDGHDEEGRRREVGRGYEDLYGDGSDSRSRSENTMSLSSRPTGPVDGLACAAD